MSSNNKIFNLATIGGIAALVISCIGIFTFVTGVTSLNLFNQSSGTPLPGKTTIVVGCVSLPGRYDAGTPVCIDGLTMTVDSNSLRVLDGYIQISLNVKDTGSQNTNFRYAANSITIFDDVGNSYAPVDECTSADFTTTKQIQIKRGQSQQFLSGGTSTPYCAGSADKWILPTYSAAIPANASKIILSFNSFGPFNGIEIAIGL